MATLGKSNTIDVGNAIDVTPGKKNGLFGEGLGIFNVPELIDVPGILGIPDDLGISGIDSPDVDDIATGIASGSIEDYFGRGIIIILGFIFVAVGLTMFNRQTIVIEGSNTNGK